MRILGILSFAVSVTTAFCTPEGRFWILRTDHKTAEFLQGALTGGTLGDDQCEEKIGALIARKSITELADFHAPIKEERQQFEKPSGMIKIRDIDELIPMGITMETDTSIYSHGPLVDLRYAVAIMEEGKRLQYDDLRINTAATFLGDRWHWLHHWRRGDVTTMILAKLSSIPKSQGVTNPKTSTLFLSYEILAVDPPDLAKFGKSTPATRSKALAWLREQGEVLDASRLICRSGERASHEHALQILTDKQGGWDTWSLGSSVDIQPGIGPMGLKTDLALKARWHDPAKPKPDPDYRFELQDTFKTGETRIIHPTTKPTKADFEIIMLLTPEVEVPAIAPLDENPGPIGNGIVTLSYPVQAEFVRMLQESPNAGQASDLTELLKTQGMAFPPNTEARFLSPNATVILRHNKAGHAEFDKIRKKIAAGN